MHAYMEPLVLMLGPYVFMIDPSFVMWGHGVNYNVKKIG